MPVPNYKGFTKDMKEVYETYAAISFTEGGEAAAKWQNVMAAIKALTEGATDKKWKTYIEKLDACRNPVIDRLTSSLRTPQELQAELDNYNKNYNDHEEDVAEQEKWALHRLMNRLIRSTETIMHRQEALEQNEKDIDEYLKEYNGVTEYVEKIGSDFDKFKDYDDFSKQAKDALNQREKLTNTLNSSPEGHLPEAENIKNLEMLQNALIEYRKEDMSFERQLRELNEKIEAQKKVELAAKEEMEKVQKNAEKIEAEARKEEVKLEEKKVERQEQMDRTLETKGQMEKYSDVIVSARTQQHQVENELKNIDKQYKKTKGFTGFVRGIGGLFFKSVREADKKAKEDHEIKSTLEGIEEASQLTERINAFKGKFGLNEDFSQTISLGEHMANKITPNLRQKLIEANENNERSLKLYQEQQELVKTMRSSFAKYKPEPEEWNKFNERMKTPEGMTKMAEELAELQRKQLAGLRDQVDQSSVDRIESKYVLKHASEDVISNAEQEIEGMQSGFRAETNRLSVKTMAVEQQAREVKNASLEMKLTSPIEKYQQEVKNREDLEQQYLQCSEKRKETKEKRDKAAEQCRMLEGIIDDQKRLRECNERIKKFDEIGKKLETFREKANNLAASGERLKNDKLRIDSNGRFGKRCTDGAAEDVYYGLKTLHDTASIGMKPGHKDTKSYRGMMDRFDAMIAGGEEELKNKSPEEIKAFLSELKTGAANYIKAKKEQSFQSWRHSPMRKARLNFAEELIKLCDTSIKNLDKVNTRVNDVQKKYNNFCEPIVDKWGHTLKNSEAMDTIKANRTLVLENEKLKKNEEMERSMKK